VSGFSRTVQRQRARGEAVERRGNIRRRWIVTQKKESLDRSRAIDHLPDDPEQRDQIGAANPPVHERREGACGPSRIETTHVLGRVVASDGQEPLDRLEHARDTAECERRGDKPDHFPVVRPLEAPDDLDRVGQRSQPGCKAMPLTSPFVVGHKF